MSAGKRRGVIALAIGTVLATLAVGAPMSAAAAIPVDAPLGTNNPGNPDNLDITTQFANGPVFPNTLVGGGVGPVAHVDPTHSNQWRMTEDVDTVKHQGGAVWSNSQLDLSQPFESTFSVYLGYQQNLGDGMTFTLQNDPRGRSAVGSAGGSLGAYGGNWGTAFPDRDVKDAEAREQYIRNALSIEFDTYMNDARNYGGESGDRELCAWWIFCGSQRFGHVGVVTPAPIAVSHANLQFGTAADPLSNDTWRDLRVSWEPRGDNTGTLRYQLGSWGAQAYEVTDVNAQFGLQNGNSNVYWGFTAAAVSKSRAGGGTSGGADVNANPMSFAVLKQPAPPIVTVTPEMPVVVQAVCTAAGQSSAPTVTPANTAGIEYEVTGSVTAGSTVTVTARPKTGFALGAATGWTTAADGSASTQVTLNTVDCGNVTVTVVPVAPKVVEAVCTSSGAPSTPTVTTASTQGITYRVEGKLVQGATVTVVAVPQAGHQLGSTSGWNSAADGSASMKITLKGVTCTSTDSTKTDGALATTGGGGAGLVPLAALLAIAAGVGTMLVARRRRSKS